MSRRMSVPALWTQHRPLALKVASGYYIPGSERQDVDQEALIGLWVAAREYDPDKGTSFPTWARFVINRHLQTCINIARTGRADLLTYAARETQLEEGGATVPILDVLPHLHQVADHVETQEQIREVLRLIAGMNDLERHCLLCIASGLSYEEIGMPKKRIDNAVQRARRKLRAAA